MSAAYIQMQTTIIMEANNTKSDCVHSADNKADHSFSEWWENIMSTPDKSLLSKAHY